MLFEFGGYCARGRPVTSGVPARGQYPKIKILGRKSRGLATSGNACHRMQSLISSLLLSSAGVQVAEMTMLQIWHILQFTLWSATHMVKAEDAAIPRHELVMASTSPVIASGSESC